MRCPFLLLELVLRHRVVREPGAAAPSTSAGFALCGAYAIELDEQLRRKVSHRFCLIGDTAEPRPPSAETFADEAALLARLLEALERTECLVTGRGRQLDVPVLEALALRHGQPLRGHFPLGEPYAARRSPYNPAGHLDLSFYLADGDRRLRALGPELLTPLVYPEAVRQPPRDFATDTLKAARRRALSTYLLLLRVQSLRGRLPHDDLVERKGELVRGLQAGLVAAALGGERPGGTAGAAGELALVQASAQPLAATEASTALDGTEGGDLAFDIETALDTDALSRCVGWPVTLETAPAALAELLGTPTDFAPAPFHKVVALAMVHRQAEGGPVELERLVLGGQTSTGAPLPDEAALLTCFWRVARDKRLLSYNGKRFDLPVLLLRALPYPIDCGWFLEEKRPPFTQYRHPQSARQLDLFEQLSGGLSPGRLGDLLQTVGLPGKQGTSGNDVEALWARRDLGTLGDYCLSDAAQTFLLGLRFLAVAGELELPAARQALLAARDRFAGEPALARMLAATSPDFFGAA